MPIPTQNIDALAACWVRGGVGESRGWPSGDFGQWKQCSWLGDWWHVPAYTTDPAAAMRLQIKYGLTTRPHGTERWIAYDDVWDDCVADQSLCRAITASALLAALEEKT